MTPFSLVPFYTQTVCRVRSTQRSGQGLGLECFLASRSEGHLAESSGVKGGARARTGLASSQSTSSSLRPELAGAPAPTPTTHNPLHSFWPDQQQPGHHEQPTGLPTPTNSLIWPDGAMVARYFPVSSRLLSALTSRRKREHAWLVKVLGSSPSRVDLLPFHTCP